MSNLVLNNKVTKTMVFLLITILILNIGILIGRQDKADGEYIDNMQEIIPTVTPTITSKSLYAVPEALRCEAPDELVTLPWRMIGSKGVMSGYDNNVIKTQNGQKFVSIGIYIKYTGSFDKPVQISAEDFRLVYGDGKVGVPFESADINMYRCSLNLPRNSDEVFLKLGQEITGALYFLVDEDEFDNFRLYYNSDDLDEEVLIKEIKTLKLPIS